MSLALPTWEFPWFKSTPSNSGSSQTHNLLHEIDALALEYTLPPMSQFLENGEYSRAIDIVCNATPGQEHTINIAKFELLSRIYTYLLTEMKSPEIQKSIIKRTLKALKDLLPNLRESKHDTLAEIEKIAILQAEKLSSEIEASIDTWNDYDTWSGSVRLFEFINSYFYNSPIKIFSIQEKTLKRVVDTFGDKYLNSGGYLPLKQGLSNDQYAWVIFLIETYKKQVIDKKSPWIL